MTVLFDPFPDLCPSKPHPECADIAADVKGIGINQGNLAVIGRAGFWIINISFPDFGISRIFEADKKVKPDDGPVPEFRVRILTSTFALCVKGLIGKLEPDDLTEIIVTSVADLNHRFFGLGKPYAINFIAFGSFV